MNFDQILYIVEVGKHNSLSIAAHNLHVTQSGISQSITSLEKELGIKIFNRTRGQGAIPTDEGKIIIKQAYQVLKKLDEIKETANSFQSKETGLEISSSPGLMRFLVKAIEPFRLEYPNVMVGFDEKNVSAVIEDVRQHKTDIGLILYSSDWDLNMEGIAFEVLLKGKLKVYVSKHSPLASLGYVTPKDILDQTLVIFNGEFMQIFVRDFFHKYKPMKRLYTTNNIDGVLQPIIEGLAITFSPDFILNNYTPVIVGDIIPIKLVNHEPVNFSFGIIRPEDRHLSIPAIEYINFLRAEISKGSM